MEQGLAGIAGEERPRAGVGSKAVFGYQVSADGVIAIAAAPVIALMPLAVHVLGVNSEF